MGFDKYLEAYDGPKYIFGHGTPELYKPKAARLGCKYVDFPIKKSFCSCFDSMLERIVGAHHGMREKAFMVVDDDVEFNFKPQDFKYNLKILAGHFKYMPKCVIGWTSESKRHDAGSIYTKNARLHRNLMFNLDGNSFWKQYSLNKYDPHYIGCHNPFDVGIPITLQMNLMRNGYPTYMHNWAWTTNKSKIKTGGIFDIRTNELSDKFALYIKDLYPEAVHLIERDLIEGYGQYNYIIEWDKIYNIGVISNG